jgi:hypothetical protein
MVDYYAKECMDSPFIWDPVDFIPHAVSSSYCGYNLGKSMDLNPELQTSKFIQYKTIRENKAYTSF